VGHVQQASNDVGGIKIFKVTDYEWWAGGSLEAIRVEASRQGYKPDDPDEGFESPRELTAEDLDKHQFREWEWERGVVPDGVEFISFRDQLQKMIEAGQRFPCAFASTDY